MIADFLTRDSGRVSVVCKGVRGGGKRASELRTTLQPFALLELTCFGRSQLKSLRSVQACQPAPRFAGRQWFAALYLNELLVRVFRNEETCVELFHHYQQAILSFQQATGENDSAIEIVLREFELVLLQITGFELDFNYASGSAEPIRDEAGYQFVAGEGFRLSQASVNQSHAEHFVSGRVLRQIGQRQWREPGVRQVAKRILREALLPHLGGGELQSRRLYQNARGDTAGS